MAIEFEFIAGRGFDFAATFAQRFNLEVKNHQVNVPDTLGAGTIKEVYLENDISLCMHNYQLKDTFVLKRLASSAQDQLSIKIDGRKNTAWDNNYAIEISTMNLFTTARLVPGQAVNFMAITITRQSLFNLLQLSDEHREMADMLMNNPSFVLHEGLTQEMERVLNQLQQINDTTPLAKLLFQNKTQELIYLLFVKLLTRPVNTSIPVHQDDAEKIYAVRSAILADLSLTPQLSKLASGIGMSATKMKQLFRQIFGESIYNYYQAARMGEAARLLKQLSVSETGYKIGFTNMSHFSRLFERHYQMKPKRYKDTMVIIAEQGAQ